MKSPSNDEKDVYELFRKIIFNMPLIFYIIDKDWIFRLTDGRGLRYLGMKPGDTVGLSAKTVYKDYPELLESIEKALKGEAVLKTHLIDGHYLENYIMPFYDASGEIEGIIGAAIDVSERIEAEMELMSTQKFQKALMDSVPGMLYMYNAEGKLVFWNDAHRTMTGYNDQELSQMGLLDWYKDDPESQKAVADGLGRMEATGFGEAEAYLRTKNQTKLPMYFTACPLTMDEENYFVGIGVDITSRKKAELELIEMNRTLEEKVEMRTKQLLQTNLELTAANEELNAMNEEMQAINLELATSNKKLREMQTYLIESEKMAALGNLVAGVAHEVNTPLGVGVTAASHLVDIAQELKDIRESREFQADDLIPFFQDIGKASQIILKNLSHASHLIQSFKQLSVDQSLEPQREFDMGKYLDEVLVSLSPSYKKTDVIIKTHYADNIMMVGWPGAFAQIITNLVQNSLQHAFLPGDSGHIDIELIPEESKVLMIYRDDGHGMSEDILGKIFDPFFTTKRNAGGTGLGLSVVYTIVTQRYQGSIRCESAPERGAKFIIELSKGGDL